MKRSSILFLCVTFLLALVLAVAAGTQAAPEEPAASQTRQCFYPTADSYVHDDNPTENYGGEERLHVASLGDFEVDVRRTYLQFDLGVIPDGATVLGAELDLYLDDVPDSTGSEATLQAVDGNWTEFGLTWNNQPTLEGFYDQLTFNDSPGYKTWDATVLANEWVNNQRENDGLALTVGGVGAPPALFYSSEGVSSRKPRLCVTWTVDDVSTDLTVDAIEVTQSIQDLNNRVRLVAGKRTYVRVHVSSSDERFRSFATLEVSGGGDSATLYPLNPSAGRIIVETAPDRAALNDAFLFQLPSSYTVGEVTLTTEVNPILSWRPNRYPEETSYSNNSESVTVRFEPVPEPGVVMYRATYQTETGGGTVLTHTTAITDAYQTRDWLRRAFPVPDVWLATQPFDVPEVSTVDADGNLEDISSGFLNTLLKGIRIHDLAHETYEGLAPGSTSDLRYYFLVDDDGGFLRGSAPFDGRVGAGPTGDATWGWDTDGVYGDWYTGHELGHSYDRAHAEFCDAEGGSPYPYANGRISPSLTGDDAIFGFDIGTAPLTYGVNEQETAIYGPNSRDLMTYCSNIWMSDFTYHAIMDYLQPFPLAPEGEEQVTDRLLVLGYIDPEESETFLQPLFVLPDVEDLAPRIPGDYAIVLLDGAENELARYPFTPTPMESGPPPPWDPTDEPVELLMIDELVPFVEGTTLVHILGPGDQVLASVSSGAAAPIVTLTEPDPAGTLTGDVTVSWTASDPDDNALTFNLQFSGDNGQTWKMVRYNIEETSVVVEREELPTTDQGLFRVWASDGIHTSFDVTDGVFSTSGRSPEVTILSPAEETVIASNQTLNLVARATSPNVPVVEDDQISWYSNVDGFLGNGNSLAVTGLSAGLHNFIVLVDDGTAIASNGVTGVLVVENPTLLPVPEANYELAPDPLLFYPAEGVSSLTLQIDNATTVESMDWTAIPAETWVSLSQTSGTTPATILVSVDASELGPGTHRTTLLVGRLGQVRTADVIVSIPYPPSEEAANKLFLPIIQK